MSPHMNSTDVAGSDPGLYDAPLPPGHIRLFNIDPASNSSSFEVCKLSESPSYVCLSYTWGAHRRYTTVDTGVINVQGKLHRVSQGVLDIVSRIMEWGDPERVWIDALCINQHCDAERSAQVSIMGQIYHRAKEVAVWLGRDDYDEHGRVLEACRAMEALFGRLTHDGGDVETITHLFNPETLERLGLSSVSPDAWAAFHRFWDLSWFRRAWVVQEAALAYNPPRFFWGNNELDSAMLYDTSRFLLDAEIHLSSQEKTRDLSSASPGDIGSDQDDMRPPSPYRPAEWFIVATNVGETLAKIRSLKLMIYYPPEEHNFHDAFYRKCDALAGPESRDGHRRTDCMRYWSHFLEVYRPLEASDARDHVYATLGMIKALAANQGYDVPDITVDYALSVADVYADAAKHIMEASRCVNLLCLAQDPQARNRQDLPSWVPDFSAGTSLPIQMYEEQRLRIMSKVRGKAGTASVHHEGPHFSVSSDLRTLQVRVIMLDEVVAIGEDHDELTNRGLWEQTSQILLTHECFAHSADRRESRLESLWRVMIADTALHADAVAPAEVEECFRNFLIMSIVSNMMRNPKHLDRLPSWKKLMNDEARLAKANGKEPLLTVEEVESIADEVDRRLVAIEAGIESHPGLTPRAAQASDFAKSTEPLFYRRIVLTKRGHIGIAPLSTTPGDLVCIMPEAPLPSIVRRGGDRVEKNATPRFTFLGESYIHGNPDFGSECAWKWIALE